MTEHVVCRADELAPGDVRIVTVGRVSIGVFNVDGRMYALHNRCPHRGAPLCRGSVGGTVLASRPGELVYGLEGRILRCPWHRWEFDLQTGAAHIDPERYRVKTYAVRRDGDVIVVTLSPTNDSAAKLDTGNSRG